MPDKDAHSHRARSQKWRRENKAAHGAQQKRSRQRRPEKIRDYKLRTRYGITSAEFEVLFEAQGRRCAICRIPAGKWQLDHDHTTKRVRGVLCSFCNRMLGDARDKIEVLLSGAEYLKNHGL